MSSAQTMTSAELPSSGRPIRVAIVDDHPALREGTAGLLEREPDIEVVGLAGTLAEATALLRGPCPPDVVVLDIRLGPERGLDLLAPDAGAPDAGAPDPGGSVSAPAFVLWTAFDLPQYAAYALRAGASGFVVKTAPTSDLIEAIRRASRGGLHFTKRPALEPRGLTAREHDLASLLVAGRSNDEIGLALRISTRSVEAHLTRLFERFEVGSRAALVARLVGEGWLDVPA